MSYDAKEAKRLEARATDSIEWMLVDHNGKELTHPDVNNGRPVRHRQMKYAQAFVNLLRRQGVFAAAVRA